MSGEYLPCIVAVALIRGALSPLDREAFAKAARRHCDLRAQHQAMWKDIERHRGVDYGLRIATVRGDAAAEFVARMFEDDVIPDIEATSCLGPTRPDYLVATSMQMAYDMLDWQVRLNVKAKLRELVPTAVAPLAEEVAYILQLLDSWEAWELDMQLM